MTKLPPNQSPEPTAVAAAVASHTASRRWLSFFRSAAPVHAPISIFQSRLGCFGIPRICKARRIRRGVRFAGIQATSQVQPNPAPEPMRLAPAVYSSSVAC